MEHLFVAYKLNKKEVKILYCPTEKMVEDFSSKLLLGPGRYCEALGGTGRPWEALGGHGRSWEVPGRFLGGPGKS